MLSRNRKKLIEPEIGAYADNARRLDQNQLRRGSLLTFGASHILDHEHRRTELSRNGF
jgi:hypothetical protein